MKLLRVGEPGFERPAILDKHGIVRDISGIVEDINGAAITPESLEKIERVDTTALPEVNGTPRIGSCISGPGKIICIGLNYSDHAKESGMDIPHEPIIFAKATSSLSGPNDPVFKPVGSTKMDWEVELAVIIGSECRYIDEVEAADAIAGYAVCNDVSERSFQLERSGQWVKGKGCDTFCPLGPWLVTADEISDVTDLNMRLVVNGRTFQNGSTGTMIFKPAFIVSYLSHFMSLQPGDVILTGTPPGVGMGQKPPVFLDVGDEMVVSISGLGEQRQVVVQTDATSKL